MNVRRIFAQAFARRLAYVVVGFVLLAIGELLGVSEAHAQTGEPMQCDSYSKNCSREIAYQTCKAWIQWKLANGHNRVANDCQHVPVQNIGFYGGSTCRQASGDSCQAGTVHAQNHYYNAGCPAGSVWDDTFKACNTCGSRPPLTSTFKPPNGSMSCSGSCVIHWNYNGDGTSTGTPGGSMCKSADWPNDCSQLGGYHWNGILNVCVPNEPEECPAGEEAGPDGVCKPPVCPEGMSSNAMGICEPNNQQCPAGKERGPDGACVGDTQCPAGQVKGQDGTCKPDADDDGEEDESDKNKFAGGDDCNVPPMCSGDEIMCGQARIQWRTECHLRRDFQLAGGHCEAVPVCTGRGCNAMEYAQLLQQWKASCALEAIAQGTGGTPGDPGNNADANGNGIPDILEQEGSHIEIEQGEVGTVGAEAWSTVDTGGWLGGGGCPGLPDVLGPGLGAMACEQGSWIQWLMRLLALVTAGVIIGRAASGSAA